MYLEDHIKRAQHTGIMRTKLKVGYEMTTLLMAGCRIYFGQKRVCSFLTYGILNLVSNLTAGCGMKNGKPRVTEVTRRRTGT